MLKLLIVNATAKANIDTRHPNITSNLRWFVMEYININKSNMKKKSFSARIKRTGEFFFLYNITCVLRDCITRFKKKEKNTQIRPGRTVDRNGFIIIIF